MRGVSQLGSLDRRVWLLVGAMVVFRFGHGLYFPFSSIYFHNVLGIPLLLVGVGLGAFAVASVVSGLLSGPLSDRYGRKPVMMVALLGSVTTFSLFAAVEGFAGYLAVSVGAGLAGMTTFDAARNAMVADVTEPGMRGRAYGVVRVGGNVGWALGPMVAGLASAAGGASGGVYPKLFLGTGALSALVAVAVAYGVRESRPVVAPGVGVGGASSLGVSSLREAFSDGRLVALLGAGVLLYYVFTQDWQAVPVYASNYVGVQDGAVGFLLGANGLMVILFQIPVSGLVDRGSKAMALLAGAGLFALSALTLLVTDSFFGILLAFAGFFTLGEMVLEVAGASLAAELAPERLRGTYLALFGCCFGAACGVSPVVAGALLDGGLPDVIWALQLVAAVLAGAVLLPLLRRKKGAVADR